MGPMRDNLREIYARLDAVQSQAETDREFEKILEREFTDSEHNQFDWSAGAAMLPGFDPPAVEML